MLAARGCRCAELWRYQEALPYQEASLSMRLDEHGLHQRECGAHRLEQPVGSAQHGAQLQLARHL